MTPPPSLIGEEAVATVVKAACTAMDVHLRCTYPECACKRLPIGIRAAISAHLAALKEAGWACVPIEPTNAMLHEAAKAMSPDRRPTPERVSVKQKHRIRYQAMISAAPPAQKGDHDIIGKQQEEIRGRIGETRASIKRGARRSKTRFSPAQNGDEVKP